MNTDFFHQVVEILHSERIDAYRQDGAEESLTLGRYCLNVALSESLYPVLQFAEVALRNAIHTALTDRGQTEAWYDQPRVRLLDWQRNRVKDARRSIEISNKEGTSGRIVAELSFGFWTGFFNRAHGQTGVGHYLAGYIFPHAPEEEQNFVKLGRRWKAVRDLRNRVFHHERIVHWQDLHDQHNRMLQLIGWMNPELEQLARMLDRFTEVRTEGLTPWRDRLSNNWPANHS